MFIIKLYRHSKAMFFCFATFVLLFLFINYKWGVVATPILQYGMYSGKYHLEDTITFYHVTVNGKPLGAARLSPGENDKMQSCLGQYTSYQKTNEETYNTMSKYMGKLGLRSFANHGKYNIEVPGRQHYNWLKTKMQQATKEPVTKLTATKRLYTWTGTGLQPVNTAVKILFVAIK